MSLTAWQKRLITASKSGRPHIENQASYNRMRNEGWEFDDNLTPVRGRDRNYAVGAFPRGWWCFYYPSHAQHTGDPHPFSPWGNGIVAAIRKGSTAGYAGDSLPGISFTMNLLPFLPDGVEAVKLVIDGLNEASRAILYKSWLPHFRPCYDEIAEIACWRPDGYFHCMVSPKEAVRIIDAALGVVSDTNNEAKGEAVTEPTVQEIYRAQMAEAQDKVEDKLPVCGLWRRRHSEDARTKAGQGAVYGLPPAGNCRRVCHRR